MQHSNVRAFSLVELSIVLVIIGLLVGGVLSGQSLIHAAELRSVSADVGRFVSATQSFRDKYFGLPGDMKNATAFWGTASAGCTDDTPTASPGTCNGDGDGKVNWCPGGSAYACKEPYWYWQQLALAGIIEGKYTGAGRFNPTESVAGYNVPPSKISNGAYWSENNRDFSTTSTNYSYSIDYGNFLTLPSNTVTPTDAWNIDKKMDDGMPGQGKVVGAEPSDPSFLKFGANTCTTSAGSYDFAGNYLLTSTAKNCTLAFIRAF